MRSGLFTIVDKRHNEQSESDSDNINTGADINRSDATPSPDLTFASRMDDDINALDNITDFEQNTDAANIEEYQANDTDSNNRFDIECSESSFKDDTADDDEFTSSDSDIAATLSDGNIDADNIPFAPFIITFSDTEAKIKTPAEMAADLDNDTEQLNALRENFESYNTELGNTSAKLRRHSDQLHDINTTEIDGIGKKIQLKFNTISIEIEKALPFLRGSTVNLDAKISPPQCILLSATSYSLQIISSLTVMSKYIAATLRTLPDELSDDDIQTHFSEHHNNAKTLIDKNMTELKSVSEQLKPVIAKFTANPPLAPSIEYNKTHV